MKDLSNDKLLEPYKILFVRYLLFILLSGFSAATFAQKNSKAYYHEDLYSLRPKLEEPVDTATQRAWQKGTFHATHSVNAKVDKVLDSINLFNMTRKFIDGYTIQIYSGQNREEAMNTKKKMLTDAPDLNSELEYNQPKFRVRVGSYFSRLEAQKDLVRLKRSFPNAILVPEKILVR